MRERHFYQSFLKVVGVAVLAQFATACSSDILRFSDSPFGNPFQGRADTASTGAVNAPLQRVSATSLPVPPRYQALPGNVGSTGQVASAAVSQVAAGPVAGGVAGWTTTGGTGVTIGAGDTVEALSNRYGVPVAALRAANGLNGGQPSVGQKFTIPTYKPGAAAMTAAPAAPVVAKVASTAPVQAATQARTPRYESLSQPPAKKVEAPRTPRYESLSQPAKAAVAKPVKKAEPLAKQASKPVAKPAPVEKAQVQAKKPVAVAAPAKKTVAKASVKQAVDDDEDDQPLPPKLPAKTPVKAPKVATAPTPVAKPVEKAAVEAPKPETTASATQEFRWPARGRVISGFGSKGPSGSNDGINIAVPEGTPVKAAEGGTVAYAGEEIKGYGKMVLIRHPNGYVSAYAHNGDLAVKRGDTVKRGQQIAKSGQTGNVTSPQLHFELRKGSEPVDPSKFLD